MARTFARASSETLYTSSCPISARGYSFGFWFRTPTDGAWQVLGGLYDASAVLGKEKVELGMYMTFPGDPLRHQGNSAASNFNATNGISLNTWHTAMTVETDNENRHIFLDSTKTTDIGTDGGNPTLLDQLCIGGAGGFGFPGTCSDADMAWFCIWDALLTDSECLAFAAGYHPYLIRPESLVMFLPMGGLDSADDDDVDLVGGLVFSTTGTPTTTDHPPGLIYPSQQFIPFQSAAAAGGTTNQLLTLGVG